MNVKCPLQGLALLCLSLVVVLALVGCEGDRGPAGPEGPAGPTGPTGPLGATACFVCHSDAPGDTINILARATEYDYSLHATSETFVRRTSPCLGCHTNEGFIERIAEGGFPTEPLTDSSHITCFTCHQPHTAGDFVLRTTDPVTFLIGAGTYDRGPSNLCANCHQPREANPPIPAAGETMTPTSSHWGPHDGTQSAILNGVGGFVEGTPPESPHASVGLLPDGCVTCHMAPPPATGLAAAHTWSMVTVLGTPSDYVGACNVSGCHASTPFTTFDSRLTQTVTDSLLTEVKNRLVAAGLVDTDDLVLTTHAYTQAEAQAVWNYLLVLHDGSMGIHNTDYAQALLERALVLVPAPAADASRSPLRAFLNPLRRR